MEMKKLFTVAGACVTAFAAAFAAPQEIVRQDIVENEQYPFFVIANLPQDFNVLACEAGSISYRQDGGNLCVTVKMKDGDLVNEAVSDQSGLQKVADCIQLFIKPENDTRMWEVLATAGKHKSCFFHWGAGRMFYPPASAAPPVDVDVKSSVTADGWMTEIRFPLAEVCRKYQLDPQARFLVMAVRWHYGKDISRRVCSSAPQAVKVASDPTRFARLFQFK